MRESLIKQKALYFHAALVRQKTAATHHRLYQRRRPGNALQEKVSTRPRAGNAALLRLRFAVRALAKTVRWRAPAVLGNNFVNETGLMGVAGWGGLGFCWPHVAEAVFAGTETAARARTR
jgi:hypothetical protein